MRIAQMLDTLYLGGAQKMQLFLVETLQPLGIDLTVITLGDDDEDTQVAKSLRSMGVRVVSFPFAQLFSPGSFVGLVRFLQAEKFDLLHAYLAYSNIMGSLAGRITGTPVIASLRSANFSFEDTTSVRVSLENFCLRHFATRVMANGQAVAEFARRRLENSREVDIVTNAVEMQPGLSAAEREQVRIELCGSSASPVILSLGRLTEAKGFFDLLDAFAILRGKGIDARLVIAGGGSLQKQVESRIRELGLQEAVSLPGRRDDVARLLAAADVYVNSSHWEGTPVSVMEAMSAGLAVVATSVGENPYLLEHGALGMLVPAHKPEELAAALEKMLLSPEERHRFGEAAQQRMRQQYTREIWRANLLELYAKVTPKARPYLAKAPSNVLLTSEA